MGAFSGRFRRLYAPVAVNKAYFDRRAVYCPECRTGAAIPFFTKEKLDEYYRTFYWGHRGLVDGSHTPQGHRPNDAQIWWLNERFSWIKPYLPPIGTVLDFGAGDCAAGWAFAQRGIHTHVVDPSSNAEELAGKYSLGYSRELAGAPMADLVYSAHSLEHVHDLLPCFDELYGHVKRGGHLFLETPNVEDIRVFHGVVLTPHTFTLSDETARRLAERVGAEVIAIDTCGPLWSESHPGVTSSAKTDLRVLLRKP